MSKLTSLFGVLGLLLALTSSGMQRGNPSPLLPDITKTPGDVLDVTKADICQKGYTKRVRNVPEAVKRQVYASYGITNPGKGEYEVDHLISLELGGSNSIRNLWPQSYRTQPWNARVKDALENRLHKLICTNQVPLRTAQQEIAHDWVTAYRKYFHTDYPQAKGSKRGAGGPGRTMAAGQPHSRSQGGRVWVNTKSGKYFQRGNRYYGKTKEGVYMSEAEARTQGYVPGK